MNEQKLYFKVDAKIYKKQISKEIIEMFDHLLNKFIWRLEVSSIKQLIGLMRCETLF